MVVWVYEKSAQCPAGRRHATHGLLKFRSRRFLSHRDRSGVDYEQESMPQDTRPFLPRAQDKLHRQMACAEDSHLLVQIQYLIIAKHAFHTNWSHFHR